MKTFSDYVMESTITPREHEEFVYICSDWALFCLSLTKLNKLEVLKLLKYLVEERRHSNLLLKRSIGRFNRLNLLTKEALIEACKRKK